MKTAGRGPKGIGKAVADRFAARGDRVEAVGRDRLDVTDEQMVTILREADQRAVPDVAKKHGVSAQTIYAWRKHFGTLEPVDVKRLRQLEHENGRLKKLVADLTLDIDLLKEVSRKKW